MNILAFVVAIIALNVYLDWCDRNGTLDLSIPPAP